MHILFTRTQTNYHKIDFDSMLLVIHSMGMKPLSIVRYGVQGALSLTRNDSTISTNSRGSRKDKKNSQASRWVLNAVHLFVLIIAKVKLKKHKNCRRNLDYLLFKVKLLPVFFFLSFAFRVIFYVFSWSPIKTLLEFTKRTRNRFFFFFLTIFSFLLHSFKYILFSFSLSL